MASNEGAKEGGKLVKKTVKWQDKMAEDQVILAPDRTEPIDGQQQNLAQAGPREPGVVDEQFPTAALGAKEPEKDKEMMTKLQMQDPARPGYTPFGKLYAKDADFEWMQRKKAAVEYADFQAWFARNFDLMSPAQKARAKELFPEFYKERKKLLKQQAKNVVRLANLKLNGVENFDDLYLQYLAETGRLDLGPVQNLLHPEAVGPDGKANVAYQQAKFQRGLLSPWRVFGEEAMPWSEKETQDRTREREQMYFAARSYDPWNKNIGYTSGFPPLGEAPSPGQAGRDEVSAANWWQKLKMQV
jgi:hypothetical protein